MVILSTPARLMQSRRRLAQYRNVHMAVIVVAAVMAACFVGVQAPSGFAQTPFAEGSSPSCNLYASTSGSDSNAGTQSAPFRSLSKLVSSLRAGQTGCLQSGETFDSNGNVALEAGEAHGEEGRPVTITSTDPGEPATITHSLAIEAGVNYLTIEHVDFNWTVPKPWVCWNAEGNIVPGKIISGPGKCATGTPYAESAVQIAIGGKGDSLNYDEITNSDTNICIVGGSHGEGDVLEHDRIHDCGPTVETSQSGFPVVNEETGWHSHGVYDFSRGMSIKNNYIYDNSRDGVLLYGGGEGAVVEHNLIDHNGAGIWFGDDSNDRAAWNIVTDSTSPRGVADYGIGSDYPGSGNVAEDNCLGGNLSGEVQEGGFAASNNKTGVNPLYLNAQRHEYTLSADSPCLGYGPDTAQPVGGAVSEPAPAGGEASNTREEQLPSGSTQSETGLSDPVEAVGQKENGGSTGREAGESSAVPGPGEQGSSETVLVGSGGGETSGGNETSLSGNDTVGRGTPTAGGRVSASGARTPSAASRRRRAKRRAHGRVFARRAATASIHGRAHGRDVKLG
jgi:hypothetical protein